MRSHRDLTQTPIHGRVSSTRRLSAGTAVQMLATDSEPAWGAKDELDVGDLLDRIWKVSDLTLAPTWTWAKPEAGAHSNTPISSPPVSLVVQQQNLEVDRAMAPAHPAFDSPAPSTRGPDDTDKPRKSARTRRSLMAQRERNRR